MKARYASRCGVCHRTHIKEGDTIVKWGSGWGRADCVQKGRRALKLLKSAQDEMIKKHRIALGVWGIPNGATPTYNRGSWLSKAEKLGVLDDEEVKLLRWYWRGLLMRALDD